MTPRCWLTVAAVGGASVALSLLAAPRVAHACGGFFCSTSPVDQAGETIVYALEADGTLTMSVRVRYRGNDDDFAWILPVPAPPELSLGSDALFAELTRTTQPAFVTDEETRGSCRAIPQCVSDSGCTSVSGCGLSDYASDPDPYVYDGPYVDAGDGEGLDAAPRDAGAPQDGVTIFSQGPIGPYETAVLGAASADEVLAWLTEHGYDIPASSAPLLESYAASGQVFVALRLSSDARTRELHPITMRMPTSEACLPIRLTAIATVPNLPITAFFLGGARVTPFNYSSADVPVNLALFRGTLTWEAAATRAVDALGGQAFVTDYAGPTPALTLELSPVDDLATELDPSVFLRTLSARGYAADPRMLELLQRFLTPPPGTLATDYYNCLATRGTPLCGEPTSFVPAGLAAAIDQEVTAPRRAAQAMLSRHGYLTRLYTTLSAEEMTVDPIFVPDAGLAPHSNVHRATLVTECSEAYFADAAPRHWELGAARVEQDSGVPASDRAYCSELGGVPDYEAPDCSDDSSDGCSPCTVAGVAPMQGGVLFGVLLTFLGRRRVRNKG